MALNSRCSQLNFTLNQALSSSGSNSHNYQPLSSNSLYDLLETGSFTNEAYKESVAPTSWIWIVLAIIILGIFVAYAAWLKNGKANRLPSGQKYTKTYFVVGIVLCTLALAIAFQAIDNARSNYKNGENAACALVDFLGQVHNGSEAENWGGTEKSLLSYQRVAARLGTEVDAVQATFSTDSNEVDAKIAEYQNDLNTLAKNRANYKVKSAKYGSSLTIEPDFIAELTPISENGTYLNSLKIESDEVAETIKSSAKGLELELPHLKSKSAAYQESATKAAENYKTFSQTVSTASQSISDHVNENYGYWENINTGVAVVLGVRLALFVIMICVLISHDKFQSKLPIKIAYYALNLSIIFIIINTALLAPFQALKNRSSEHCDLFNVIEKDPKYIDVLGKQYSPETVEALKLCFFEQGDTYKAMGFSAAGTQIGKIGSYIRDIDPYLYNVNGTGSREIVAQKAIIDMYIQGILPASSDLESEDSTVINLNLLNLYSNSAPVGNKQTGLAHCSISRDMWVLNLSNCTTTRWIPAYQPQEYLGDEICLGILSLDSGNIDDRYKDSSFSLCSLVDGQNIADILVNQYDALNAHFEDVRIKFGQLKRFYDNNLKLKYNEILKAAGTITEPIQDFNNSFSGLLQYVTSPEDGLLYNSNCSFFKSGLSATNNFVCEAASTVTTTYFAQIVSIFAGLVGCVFVYFYLGKLEGPFKKIKDDDESDMRRGKHREMQQLDASMEDDDRF